MGSLSAKFSRSACPAGLPVYDSGIDPAGKKVALADVVGLAARHADIVQIGDTNHFNTDGVIIPATSPSVLKTFQAAGGTDIAIEIPQDRSLILDAFEKDSIGTEEFKRRMHMNLIATQGNEKGQWTQQVVAIAEHAKTSGMKLHFADPQNGNAFCASDLSTKAFESCEVSRTNDRYQDEPLAAYLNEATSGKTLLVYGANHFSVNNGSREALDGTLVKIDTYANRMEYERSKDDLKFDNERGITINDIKPDLIYFQDSSTVHTTCATPDILKKGIENLASASPTASQAPTTVKPTDWQP